MTVIVITGTPASGKTTLAKQIAKNFGFQRIDVARLIREKRLSDGYDKKRKCAVVDTDRLVKELLKRISKGKNWVIDSHLGHYLPAEYVDLCIVTRCELKELKKRLEKRYDDDKVRENLDAEIFDVCYAEAKEFGHRVVAIDTTKPVQLSEIRRLLGLSVAKCHRE